MKQAVAVCAATARFGVREKISREKRERREMREIREIRDDAFLKKGLAKNFQTLRGVGAGVQNRMKEQQ